MPPKGKPPSAWRALEGQATTTTCPETVATNPRTFASEVLGRTVTLLSASKLSPEDLEDLLPEVGGELASTNAAISAFGSRARATGEHLHPRQWSDLQTRRGFLVALHQQLQTDLGKLRRQDKAERNARQEAAGGLPVEHHFLQVVKNEASRVDYQRWLSQAEARHRDALTRQQKQQQQESRRLDAQVARG
jgi:hypothetical protein